MSTTLKFEGQDVQLNLKPGTLFRLAQAGYSFPESFGDSATALLASTELLRICSKTKLSCEEIADRLIDYESLTAAVIELFNEEEQRIKEKQELEETDEGNG